MSTARPAGFGLIFFGACFAYGLGCSSSSTAGGPASDGGVTTAAAGAGGSRAGAGGTASSGGAGGGSAGSGGSGGAPANSKLGAGCKADTDCGGAPLTCIKSTDNLSAETPGGPGNGLCTVDCTANRMACAPYGGLCAAIDVAADNTVTKALCFESCAVGPARPQPPVPKCHSRAEVVCRPVNAAETVFACIPLCVSDTDCGGTRKCEAASGTCVDAPVAGKTVGSGCTASAATLSSMECAGGLCLPIESVADGGSTPGICTAFCNLGVLEGCNFHIGALDAGPAQGACIFPWSDTGYNSGDLGFCLQLCDTPNDCGYRSGNWTCRTDIQVGGTGHAVCLPPIPG